jgi:urease accessory protein
MAPPTPSTCASPSATTIARLRSAPAVPARCSLPPSPGETAAVFAANRAQGRVTLSLDAAPGGAKRRRVHEEGSLRVRFPGACAGISEAVLINTGGGIAGGDHLSVALSLSAGARLALTTAAAEKVYRSLDENARVDLMATLAQDAELIWLPQETILFDRARLARTVEVALAPEARLVFAEAVVFGRAAMGERVGGALFVDRWRVRRGDRLVFAENFRLDGAIADHLDLPAIARGATAIGTLLLVPGDDEMVATVRAQAPAFRGEAAISAWNGISLTRFAAADGAALRHDLVLALTALGRGALPRSWLN